MDVDTQLRLGVRLLQGQVHMCVFQMFIVSPIGLIYILYILLGMGRILASATPVSLQKIKFMVVVRTINADFPYSFLLHYSLRKSFIILVCALF